MMYTINVNETTWQPELSVDLVAPIHQSQFSKSITFTCSKYIAKYRYLCLYLHAHLIPRGNIGAIMIELKQEG